MREGHYLVLKNRWRNSSPVKLMKLYYADLFPAQKRLKKNKQLLLRRLDKYEGGSLFSVEESGEKFVTRQINEVILCCLVSSPGTHEFNKRMLLRV